MRQGTARPKKMQSSRGKKLHRTPPLPSMEEIKCQLHHPRKEAEPVPHEPCRNELVTSRDTSGHFRVFASPPSVCTAPFLSPALRILHAILHANCRLFLFVFFSHRFPFPPSPFGFGAGAHRQRLSDLLRPAASRLPPLQSLNPSSFSSRAFRP